MNALEQVNTKGSWQASTKFPQMIWQKLSSRWKQREKNSIDPIPVPTFKEVLPEFLPYTLEIVNVFSQDVFQAELKHSSITPIMKHSGADSKNMGNYIPINNTAILEKILEKSAL